MMKCRHKITLYSVVVFLFVSVFAFPVNPAVFAEEGNSAVYQIKTSVNSKARGRITATSTVQSGASKQIQVRAASGYYLSDLLVDNKSVGAAYSYTFKNVQQSHTVKAVFSKSIRIMLDAGHAGKYNRSPVYSSYYESIMNWDLQNYLKAEILAYNGTYVGVTRSSQTKDMDVYYRGKAAAGYDLFLSIHSNATSSSSTDYPLIVTQKGDTGHALAKNLAKSIQTTMKTKQAYKIWQKLESNGAEYYGVLRGSKSAGTRGMIVEHSFHTNLTATKWLSNQNNLKTAAKNEAAVIAAHYNLKLKSPDKEVTEPQKPTPKPPASQTVSSTQKVKVLVGSLNMRASYSMSAKVKGTAKKNKAYQLKAKTKDGLWGQIKDNGYWIYLKKGYTKVVSSSAPSKVVKSSEKVKVIVSSLNMRASYSTSSKVKGTAKKNKVYQLKAKTRDGLWGQIKSNGYWIYLKGYTKKV